MKRYTYIIVAAACILAGCSKTRGMFAPDEIPDFRFSFAAKEMKAGEIPAEDLAEYTVYITDKETSKVVATMKYGDIESSLVAVGPGTYTILAESCTEAEAEEGNGCLRIAGRGLSDIVVSDGSVSRSQVICSVASAKVTVEFSSDFDEYFENYSLVFDDARNIVVNSTNITEEFYWNVPEEGTLNLKFRVEGTAMEDGSLKMATGAIDLTRGLWAPLKFSLSKE